MSRQGSLIQRILIERFGGIYSELIGRHAPVGAAAVVFDGQGRVLLVHHSYGRRGWELPGGGRRSKESLDEAVRRELREEVGVEVTTAELFGVYYERGFDHHHFAFRCALVPGSDPKASSPEITECGFYAFDELPRPMTEFTRQRIADAQAPPKALTIRVLGPRRWLA